MCELGEHLALPEQKEDANARTVNPFLNEQGKGGCRERGDQSLELGAIVGIRDSMLRAIRAFPAYGSRGLEDDRKA